MISLNIKSTITQNKTVNTRSSHTWLSLLGRCRTRSHLQVSGRQQLTAVLRTAGRHQVNKVRCHCRLAYRLAGHQLGRAYRCRDLATALLITQVNVLGTTIYRTHAVLLAHYLPLTNDLPTSTCANVSGNKRSFHFVSVKVSAISS